MIKAIVRIITLLPLLSCQNNPTQIEDSDDPFKEFDSRVNNIVEQIKPVEIPDRTINLIDYSGHKPDRNGTYNFQSDINKAIKELAAKGGGTLHFAHTDPPGKWDKITDTYKIIGPVHLESNIELLIDRSVRLYFEFDLDSYLPDGEGVLRRYEGTTLYSFSPQIYAFNKKNIRIRGNKGSGGLPVIDGDGESWIAWSTEVKNGMEERGEEPYWDFIRAQNNNDVPLRERHYFDYNRHPFRPIAMEFFMCENIEVDQVKMDDYPFWGIHPVFSKNMWFHDMIFDSQNVNNDGFDPESSKNILIENIIFNNHDDNLAIKAGRDLEGREGVDITGTELEGMEWDYIKDGRLGGSTENIVMRNCTMQGHYGVAIGSEMSGGVNNVYVYDCEAPIYVKAGVFVKSSRKRGGTVQNVFVKDLFINRTEMLATLIPNYDKDTVSAFPPQFSDIHIKDIVVNETNNSIRVYGWPDRLTKDVTLSNIRIDKANKDIRVNHVENVQLNDVTINGEEYSRNFTKSNENELPPWQN